MAEFRNILANGDLIRERKRFRWWPFGDTTWAPYRNLSREVRYLEELMHNAHAVYQSAREDFVVAQANVRVDTDILRVHKLDNSEVSLELPSDESILSRREGVKYNSKGNSSGNQNNGKGNGQQNNQKGGDNGGGNNQNQNQNQSNKQKQQPKSLLELLAGAKVILH